MNSNINRRNILKLGLAAPFLDRLQTKEDKNEDYIVPVSKVFGELISVKDLTDWSGCIKELSLLGIRNKYKHVEFPINNNIEMHFSGNSYLASITFNGINMGSNHLDNHIKVNNTVSMLLRWQSNLNQLLSNNNVQLDICRQLDKNGGTKHPSVTEPIKFQDNIMYISSITWM
jgi:hypothetical protein